ncbi:MAG: M20/M25/M40 family metallo-hydrolase, partial [Oscillospiraceae bacterium]|nr:M20/M25/M40 family metallo-hydrolase [Oscillospiraceae bacterium]
MLYILIALAVLLAVILIRAAAFRPAEEERAVPDPIEYDAERAIQHLRSLVMCRTVSYEDSSKEDGNEFDKLRAMLPELYPNVFRNCDFERVGRTGLLFRWKGASSDSPSVLMAHYDVVPVDERGWDKPAFDGIIEDGELWGRGTLDTKITFCSSLEAAETLMEKGFVPRNDIYFSYAGDEEVFGTGASDIVDLLEERGIRPQMVVDEGGAVV